MSVKFSKSANYSSLYILKHEVLEAYQERLVGKGISLGKGCIRYAKPERIDFEIVEAILEASGKSDAPIY